MEHTMNHAPSRLRATARAGVVLVPVLLVALFGASSVSAAEDPAPTPSATVAGLGRLAATGDGEALLVGSYFLAGSLEGGSLTVRGVERRSIIRVTGWTSKTRLADGSVVYRFGDHHGLYRIAGRSLTTTIESDAMRFRAAGRGRATLTGDGSYWVNGRGPLPWADPGVEEAF
jgi:hypothetical protein